jgi:tetratricopeptide (TPR) repeat protein
MARIPTINAQNITPPPGTAGGVLLNNPGTSNVQIKTPLTQQMNPAQFGQEGAAIVRGANNIFQNALMPRIRRDARNRRFTEYSDTIYEINGEVDAFALDVKNGNIEFDQYNRPRDINKEININTTDWLGRIEKGISDPRYRGAAKTQFAQKIATMQLSAANRLTKLSNAKVEGSFQNNVNSFVTRFKPPTKQSTALGDVTTYQNWDIALAELQTLFNTLENSGLDEVKKLELRDKGRLQIFNQIAEQLKLEDPKLGMEWVRSDQVEMLLEGTSTGEKAKGDALKAFQDTVRAQIEYENKIATLEEKRSAEVSIKYVDDNYISLFTQISQGTDQRMNLVWLESTWKKHFKNANREDDYKTLYEYAAKYSYEAGETDPTELYKAQQQIFNGDLGMGELFRDYKRISDSDKTKLSAFHDKRTREGDWLFNDPQFKLAREAFEKAISIPANSGDTNARRMGTVAMGLMMEKVSESLTQGQKWSKKNDDWGSYFKNLMNNYGSLHDDYSAEHTQLYLGNLNDRLPKEMQDFRFPGNNEKTIVYDWQRMSVQAHKMATEGKLQGKRLQDTYNVIDQMKSIITPSSLNGMINQKGVKDPGERGNLQNRIGKGTARKQFFKFSEPPQNIPGRIPVIPEPAKPTPELSPKPQKRTPISPVPPVEAQTEMFPEMVSDSNVNPDEFDLATMADEDVNAIRNIILDLAEGKSISNLRNYSDGNITNYGIAQKIWEEVPEDLKKNPNDEALKKLFDQNNIPYKAQ